jgi:hypothetical protein
VSASSRIAIARGEHAGRVQLEPLALDGPELFPGIDVPGRDLQMLEVELDRVVEVLLLRGLAGPLDHLGRRRHLDDLSREGRRRS